MYQIVIAQKKSVTRLIKYNNFDLFASTISINPKRPRLLEGVLFGEMKFVLSNFLSSEDLSISYES